MALSQREFKHQDQHCFIINAMVSWEVIDKLFEFLHLHWCSPWDFPPFHLACVLLELGVFCKGLYMMPILQSYSLD